MSRMRKMVAVVLGLTLVTSFAGAFRASADDDTQDGIERLQKAREVYMDLVKTPDRGVPQELLERAKAVAIFPGVVKAAIGVGGRHGHGVVMTRGANGEWSPPAFLTVTGGSWGLQLGANKTDVVLFFMTDKSLNSLLASHFTLGAGAGVAAGPIGRTAEAGTDLKLNSEIYSYARSRGLYAGISLNGARITADDDLNEDFYGRKIGARQILMDRNVPSVHVDAYEPLQRVLPS